MSSFVGRPYVDVHCIAVDVDTYIYIEPLSTGIINQHSSCTVSILILMLAILSQSVEISGVVQKELEIMSALATVPGLTSVILENETFPRALLYWTRAASQGLSHSLVIKQYDRLWNVQTCC